MQAAAPEWTELCVTIPHREGNAHVNKIYKKKVAHVLCIDCMCVCPKFLECSLPPPLVLLSGGVAQSVDHCSTFFADWQERHQSSCDGIQAETNTNTQSKTFTFTHGEIIIHCSSLTGFSQLL